MPERDVAYIAGPMQGWPDHNFPAFYEAEAYLLEHEPDWDILNPARFDLPGEVGVHPRAWCLRRDFTQFFRHRVKHIVRIDHWDKSVGASVETLVGEAIGCKFWTFTNGELSQFDNYSQVQVNNVIGNFVKEYFASAGTR